MTTQDNSKTRLILNHIIVLYNCFGKNTTNMLFMKLEESQATLKPFVIQLNFMPEFIEYNNKRILSSDIPMDPIVVQTLRGI